jgi:hypothetical protein
MKERAKDLLKTPGKGFVYKLTDEALKNKELFLALLEISLGNEKPYAWRACWIMRHIAKENPEMIKAHIPAILDAFNSFPYDSQKGIYLQICATLAIDNPNTGHLIDFCFLALKTEYKHMYLQLYALQFLMAITKKYPELNEELILALEQNQFKSKYLKRKSKAYIRELKGML